MWQEYIKGLTGYRGVGQKEPVIVTLNPETLLVATCCHKIVAGMKAFTCKDCGKDRALDEGWAPAVLLVCLSGRKVWKDKVLKNSAWLVFLEGLHTMEWPLLEEQGVRLTQPALLQRDPCNVRQGARVLFRAFTAGQHIVRCPPAEESRELLWGDNASRGCPTLPGGTPANNAVWSSLRRAANAPSLAHCWGSGSGPRPLMRKPQRLWSSRWPYLPAYPGQLWCGPVVPVWLLAELLSHIPIWAINNMVTLVISRFF